MKKTTEINTYKLKEEYSEKLDKYISKLDNKIKKTINGNNANR